MISSKLSYFNNKNKFTVNFFFSKHITFKTRKLVYFFTIKYKLFFKLTKFYFYNRTNIMRNILTLTDHFKKNM